MKASTLKRLEQQEARRTVRAQESFGTLWTPLPGPQTWALESEADITGYGGAGGGGKSDLLLGAALTRHTHSILYRREYPQLRAIEERSRELAEDRGKYNSTQKFWRLPNGRTLEFGSVPHVGDERKYRGRPHDLICVDEASEFLKQQVLFLLGWLRTTIPDQRCRAILAFNPPTHSDGEWILEFFAPWLDPEHPNPAEPRELRWYAMLDGESVAVETGDPFTHNGETIYPQSRTFIPAFVTDNPYLIQTGYIQTLQSLPEPLRSQLLKGDFSAGREDDAWQVIPTAWIKAAQARWTPEPPRTEDGQPIPLSCLGVDVARGGADKTVISRRYGTYFAHLEKHKGSATPDGPAVAALVAKAVRDDCRVHVDVIGWGASVYDILKEQIGASARGVNFAAGSRATDKSKKLRFVNLRAEAYWKLREALDPESGQHLALPPDNELLADLVAPRWSLQLGGIKIEAKEDIAARIGRSPDCGDAVALAAYIGFHLKVYD